MAEVLVISYTAIRDWVLNLQILLLVGVVLVGSLHCFVSKLSLYSQSAKIFKQGQVLTRAIKPLAEANLSFRANELSETTVVTYNAIRSACAWNNMSGTGYKWIHRMKAQSISLNKVTYQMLIEALTNDGKPKLAYDLCLRAQNKGLNLSSKAYDSVVHSAEIYGATVDVDILGPRSPEKKKTMPIRKNLSEFCKLGDVPRRSKPFVCQELYTRQTD